MKFFQKLGKVLMNNIAYTIVLIVASICFFYFAKGNPIDGLFTVISALVMYMCIEALYRAYTKAPASAAKKSPVKKSAKRK